jgi:hypothetical protein
MWGGVAAPAFLFTNVAYALDREDLGAAFAAEEAAVKFSSC